jgi:RNA polymerase sigma-70 factor (ECF subfamily)
MAGRDGWVAMPEDDHPGRDDLGPLIVAVANGDDGAFEAVYERLSGPVYGVILAVVRDRAQAEEVAQEVFLELWRPAFRYDPSKGSATGWALAIARHRAIDRIRSTAAASARERRTATAPPLDQVSDAASGAADRDRLREWLTSLSDPQREAIMLAFYGEHTYAEVAGLLGVPLGTLKARIRDGLARLRAGMQSGAAAPQPEATASQLQATLDSRVPIERAKGILAERLQIAPDEALVLLRRYAIDHNRPLARLADDITRGAPAIVAQHPGRSSPANPG